MGVTPRTCTDQFQPVRLVHVCVVHLTWLHVPMRARFGLYDLCTYM